MGSAHEVVNDLERTGDGRQAIPPRGGVTHGDEHIAARNLLTAAFRRVRERSIRGPVVTRRPAEAFRRAWCCAQAIAVGGGAHERLLWADEAAVVQGQDERGACVVQLEPLDRLVLLVTLFLVAVESSWPVVDTLLHRADRLSGLDLEAGERAIIGEF